MDAYDRKARLAPALCAALPVTVLVLALLGWARSVTTLSAVAGAAGVHLWIIQIVRDRGAAKQPDLWRSWGGPPTVVRLRWVNASNWVLHRRRFEDIETATGVKMPSAKKEDADPHGADQVYETAVAVLRQLTRDGNQFPLVKTENANYGFRRNLYGLRLIALTCAGVVCIISAALAVLGARGTLDMSPFLPGAVGAVALILAAAWAFIVNPDFVRRDADRYADALLAAASTLAENKRSGTAAG